MLSYGNHERLRDKFKIELKENRQENELDRSTGEDQPTKLKVVEDGRLIFKFLY